VAKDPHPQAVLEELESALAHPDGLAPGYVVRGDELYYKNRAIDALKRAALARGLELCLHDAKDGAFSVATLQDDLCGGALFAAARLVVLHSPEELLKKGDDGERPVARSIKAFVGRRAGSIVLATEGLRADHAVVKAIVAAGGGLLTFRRLYDRPGPWEREPDPRRTELAQWLVARARAKKVALAPDRAVIVATAVGNDLAALDAKLDELAALGPEGFFERLVGSAAGSPFELAGDIARGDARSALVGLETLFHGGFEAKDKKREVKPDALREILLGALRREVRRGYAGAQAVAGGATLDEAAVALGVPPYGRRDFETAVHARSAGEWRAMSASLADLERAARSSAVVDGNDLALFAVRWARRAK
jgi:DNA polymerase III delta subunit